jgi:hypothetical protein
MRVPGFDTLRVPARFATLFVLCQCVLLAFAVARWSSRQLRPQLVVALIGAGLLVDGWALVHVEQPPPAGPQWPEVVAAVVEVPLGGQHDFDAMYRSLMHGRPIVNGFSGYYPPFYLPFVSAIGERQFSALPEISRGQLLVIAVNRAMRQCPRRSFVACQVSRAWPATNTGRRSSCRHACLATIASAPISRSRASGRIVTMKTLDE